MKWQVLRVWICFLSDEGEAGELRAHGDVLGRLGGDLLGEDLVEEVGEGELLAGGLLQEGGLRVGRGS